MRKYETVFISDPDLQDQVRKDLFDKVRNIIANEKGVLIDFDEWGNKKLAYEIKKKSRGHYVCVTYGGTGELVDELERNFRLSDAILKFMTIVLTDDLTAEQLEEEIAQIQESQVESAPETPASETEETQETAADDSESEEAPKEEKTEDVAKETVEEPQAETNE